MAGWLLREGGSCLGEDRWEGVDSYGWNDVREADEEVIG